MEIARFLQLKVLKSEDAKVNGLPYRLSPFILRLRISGPELQETCNFHFPELTINLQCLNVMLRYWFLFPLWLFIQQRVVPPTPAGRATIAGTVILADSHQPIPGARITLQPSDITTV